MTKEAIEKFKHKNIYSLKEYIFNYFKDSQVFFAKYQNIKAQQVTQWINKEFIVVDHVLYSKRRELNK